MCPGGSDCPRRGVGAESAPCEFAIRPLSRRGGEADDNMVIWFYSSSRFGNCSNYSFLLSENNSMATHESGAFTFSSGQASS